MNNTRAGQEAEDAAATYLRANGYTVIEQNWRTRWCEIDIVAKKNACIFFCEVKYRQTNSQGSGLDYITPAKLRRMQRAAEWWVLQNDWQGEYQTCAIEAANSGGEPRVTSFIDQL